MGRKQDIDEELLAKKILDFESGSSDLGNLKWETIASEVFPRKKNVGIYWWSAGAAAAVVAVLLFFLPLKNEDSLSHRQSGVNPAGRIAENEAEQAVSSDLSDIQPPQVALAQVMDDPEAELPVAEVSPAVARTKAVLAEEASISGLNNSHPANAELTAAKMPAIEIQKEYPASTARESGETLVAGAVQAEEASEGANQEVLSGKKVLLVINTQPVEGDNEKKGLLKRIGNFNRSGKWEKTEKEADMWARFVESTKPEKRTAQL